MVAPGCWLLAPRRGRVEAAGAVLGVVRSLRARSWRGGMVKFEMGLSGVAWWWRINEKVVVEDQWSSCVEVFEAVGLIVGWVTW
jgi:hypothetical protein